MLSGWTMVLDALVRALRGSKSPNLGICSTNQSCASMLGWGRRQKIGVVLAYIWREA